MKIKKFQTGGFNDVISSYMSQQYPNLTSPTTNWFNQSLLKSAPNIFAGGKKNLSANLIDPKSQFKYQFPGVQPGFDTGLMTQKLNVPQSAAWAGTKTGAGIEGGLKNFLSKNAKGFSAAGQVASVGSALLGPTNSDSTTQAINSGYDVVSDAIMAVPGWGTAIGGAMKVAGFASDALNKLTGGATTVEDSKFGLDKVLSSKFLTLTPVGLANALGKSKIEGSNTDIAKTINYGYTPEDEVKKTQIGGVTKLFNKIFKKKNVKKEAEQRVLNTNTQNIKKSAVVGANSQWQQAVQNSYANTAERNQQQLMGGFGINQLRTLAAKNGTKLQLGGKLKDWWYNVDKIEKNKVIQKSKDKDPFIFNWMSSPITQAKLREQAAMGPEEINKEISGATNIPVIDINQFHKTKSVNAFDTDYYLRSRFNNKENTFPFFDEGVGTKGTYHPKEKIIRIYDNKNAGTVTHEQTHSLEGIDKWMNFYINSFYKPNLSSFSEDGAKYYKEDGAYPRIMDIRRRLGAKPGQKLMEEDISKIKDTLPFMELQLIYGKDKVVEMLNELAENEQPSNPILPTAGKGIKLYKLGNIKNEVKNKRNKTKKLQTGGTLNVIPEGAFHSRKNNINLEGITPKGIPVITLEDGGGVTQHAEIERAELIFRKELTDKIEEAYKKYKEGDESMLLEVGKLLTYEILENTDDKVGLLETVI